MNDVDHTLISRRSAAEASDLVAQWLSDFDRALTSGNKAELTALFEPDSHWRDLVAFTWHFGAFRGVEQIVQSLLERQADIQASGFKIAADRTPPQRVKRLATDMIESIFEFETKLGRGNGIVRLVEDSSAPGSGRMRAWILLTTLEELKGFEEKVGKNRPTGDAYSRNFGGENWAEMRDRQRAFADRDPSVIVIGAGQAGLAIAAHLRQLDVDTLVVEKHDRVGDNWRLRYHSLALHNHIEANHLPFMPFPPTWPIFVPKDMLANWFEIYVEAMEINCWTGCEFISGSYDDKAKCWTARLRLKDGTERVMKPRHLIFANGVSGIPKIPKLPGIEDFAGTTTHTEGFSNGKDWAGKRAFVIGTGSSGHDVAQDLHSWGVHTTMIQNGSTTVASITPSARLNFTLYESGLPIEDCDLIAIAATYPLVVKAYQLSAAIMKDLDKELVAGLRARGFKIDYGEDETGHQMKYFRRGGGYNLDQGCGQLIVDGKIGLLQYENIERFVKEGALMRDGTIVPADLIVFATGYYGQEELIRRVLGEEIAARTGQIWGYDKDGELANIWKRTLQDGLWFTAGGLPHCRWYSRYMALQLKAQDEGLIGPRPN